ncbi:hypothetical protein ACX93W_19790 [Paenibacillus sp. CAU 1782]
MITYVVVIGIGASIGIMELPPLIRQGMKGEAAATVIFLAAGTVMSIIAAKLISVPSPLNMLIWIYSPVNHLLHTIFA